jgi:hypothetical protein
LKSCHNHSNTCLVVERRHYEINTNDLRLWNSAILRGESTIHSPPVTLHPKPMHISKKRKSRSHEMYSSDPEEPATSRQDQYRPNIHYHMSNQHHSKHSKTIVVSSSPTSSPPIRGPNKSTRHASPSSSSSASIDFNEFANKQRDCLKEYVAWQVGRCPEDTSDLFGALQVLEKERYKLKQLPSITAQTWKAMGVPMGVGFVLSNDLKEFKRFLTAEGISQ